MLSHAQDAIQRTFDPTELHFSAWTWLKQYDEQRDSISETLPTPEISPLHFAAHNGFFNIAEWIITSHSQGPDAFSVIGKTLLHQACSRGNLQVAQLLNASGAGVDIWSDRDRTTLHLAAEEGYLEVV